MRTGSASFLHKGAQHQFRYGYLAGSNLLQSLAMPNGENFTPEYDADGNQTLIQTSTGIWKVQYNARNRAIRYESEADSTHVITCVYDTQGRRVEKKEEKEGAAISHVRYVYRGYLKVAAYDLFAEGLPSLWQIIWDPTQEIATRPLVIRANGAYSTYGWDLTKNICETYAGATGFLVHRYAYSPYGLVSIEGDTSYQPIQWSSEVYDAELGIVYYNYRYYNPLDGRWTRRDILGEKESALLYAYCKNNVILSTDYIGLEIAYENRPCMQVLSSNYLGKSYESDDVYKKCGGNVYANQKRDSEAYRNSCALRVSRALNHSNSKIIKIQGIASNRFISDSENNLNLLGANELMYYIEQIFGKPDLTIYEGDWADKVKDRCAIVFYVKENKNATHVGLLKDGEPYSDKFGNTTRRAHIWFVPCVCVVDDKCECCKQIIEEERRRQKRMEEFIRSLIDLQSRV